MHLLTYHYMLGIVLYVCTCLNQESNYAPRLLFKRNCEKKLEPFTGYPTLLIGCHLCVS